MLVFSPYIFEASIKTIRQIAKAQVAFSRKSVVFFAPIIWLAPPPNEEDNPPPFGFWTKTTKTRRAQVISINMVKNVPM